MSKVYVIQRPAYKDRATGEWKDKYDLSAATQYGEIKYLIGRRGNIPQNTQPTVELLRKKLEGFTSDDYLVAIGDPVAIACACMIAVEKSGGSLKILKWDRLIEGYLPYVISLY